MKKILLIALALMTLTTTAQAAIEPNNGSSKPTTTNSLPSEPSLIMPNLEEHSWYLSALGDNVSSKKMGKGVTIALLGDGVDETAPDMAGKILPNYDVIKSKVLPAKSFVNFGSGGYEGTFQAALLVSSKNKKSIQGISPESKILPIIITDHKGTSDAYLAKGINYAVSKKAQVIVIPLGVEMSLISGSPTLTCKAIKNAKIKNIMVFMPAINDQLLSKAEFDPTTCQDAIIVGSVNEELLNLDNNTPTNIPNFSVPSSNLLSLAPSKQWMPYYAINTTINSPVIAGGVAALMIGDSSQNYQDNLLALTKSAINLGSKSYFGAGLLNIPGALGYSKDSLSKIKNKISSNTIPVITNMSRDGNSLNLTWNPPVGTRVDFYNITTYKYSNNKWLSNNLKVASNIVRYNLDFDIYSNAYVTVSASVNGFLRSSAPYNDASYNPAPPVHQVSDELAAVSSSEVSWNSEGISVSVITNDSTRGWDLLIINPISGDILKHYSITDGDKRTVLLDLNSPLRSMPLLIATGIGKNGVDNILQPYYGLKVTASAAGEVSASVSGQVTCISFENVKCKDYTPYIGTLITILNDKNVTVATARLRDDGTFSTLLDYPGKEYSFKATHPDLGESLISIGSFILRN